MYSLITAANSAKAYQVKAILINTAILLGDYEELPDFLISSKVLIKLPNPASDSYTHDMLSLCLDNSVCSLYPIRQLEIAQLMRAKQLFLEFNINIVDVDGI